MKATPMVWTGRVLTGVFALFILGASVFPKLSGMPVAEETMAQLGWPHGYVFAIGLVELACLILYLIPRTSVLGRCCSWACWAGPWRRRSAPAPRCSATSCSASTWV
jgi:hypothetical protein